MFVMKHETIVTSKGTIRIPAAIRKAAGVATGSRIIWEFRNGLIQAQVKRGLFNVTREHIQKYSGTWDGYLSGEELLKRTRP
jgi:bifunctional DNA-binding transcriptional regulator/antitoxin component of YhaV-PrlF toxin-antitoxin module